MLCSSAVAEGGPWSITPSNGQRVSEIKGGGHRVRTQRPRRNAGSPKKDSKNSKKRDWVGGLRNSRCAYEALE